jgi:hypothetical protein
LGNAGVVDQQAQRLAGAQLGDFVDARVCAQIRDHRSHRHPWHGGCELGQALLSAADDD